MRRGSSGTTAELRAGLTQLSNHGSEVASETITPGTHELRVCRSPPPPARFFLDIVPYAPKARALRRE
jgi:hypothetical protein